MHFRIFFDIEMIALVVLFALAACRYEKEWREFKAKFGKEYADPETEKARFKIFKDNMAMVKLYQKTDAHAVYSHLTPFMDLTTEEFATRFTTYEPIQHNNSNVDVHGDYVVGADVPNKYDWTDYGVVNAVKDQGSCGSCWAHATTEALASSYAIKHGVLYDLSVQQLVDCDSANSGCNGGNTALAARYTEKNSVEQTKDYPYAGVDQTCKYDKSKGVVQAADYGIVYGGEDAMRAALIEHGPLSIAINANPVQFYTAGVLDPSTCNPNGLNHAVLLVGYDISVNPPYWKIMNSWGNWGESCGTGSTGCFRLVYGKDACGVSRDVVYIDAQ